MTLVDYLELAAYWEENPPTHLLVKAVIGYKGGQSRTGDLGELLAAFGPEGMIHGG